MTLGFVLVSGCYNTQRPHYLSTGVNVELDLTPSRTVVVERGSNKDTITAVSRIDGRILSWTADSIFVEPSRLHHGSGDRVHAAEANGVVRLPRTKGGMDVTAWQFGPPNRVLPVLILVSLAKLAFAWATAGT